MPNTLVKLLNLNHFKVVKITFIVSVAIIAGVIFYFPNYAKLKELRQVNTELMVKVKGLNRELKELQAKIKRIGIDPYLYEKMARDNLGVAKENEIVVDITE
jgi:cell division protein FtsB